jgi:CRISPR-associated protein Cas5t
MIRLEIYQETAHFRIPTIGRPCLSYPLPPPSTIYGFLRFITNYKSINPKNTKLSIQGKFEGVSMEKEQLLIERLKRSKNKIEITSNIISIQKLHQCKWIIHIKSPQFEEEIIKALENPSKILRLGRKEDMIIDIFVKTGLEELNFNRREDEYDKKLKIYKKWQQNEDLEGSLFKMALDTKVDDNKEIVGYIPVNLIYISTRKLSKSAKTFDGKYLIEWI